MPSAADNLIPLHLSADDDTPPKSWELAQWCSAHGADASLVALQDFLTGGIFTCEVGAVGWLEDLTLYRRGELMLGIVSHESEGILRVSHEERQLLEQGGFLFHAYGPCVGY